RSQHEGGGREELSELLVWHVLGPRVGANTHVTPLQATSRVGHPTQRGDAGSGRGGPGDHPVAAGQGSRLNQSWERTAAPKSRTSDAPTKVPLMSRSSVV